MIRYRQGVEVVARASGLVYSISYTHLLTVLLSAILYLKVVEPLPAGAYAPPC